MGQESEKTSKIVNHKSYEMKDKSKENEGMPVQGIPPQKPGVNWKMVAAIGLFWLVMFSFFTPFQKSTLSFPYSAFKRNLKDGNVASVTVKGDVIMGRFQKPLKEETTKRLFRGKDTPIYKSSKTVIPGFGDDWLMGLLEENQVTVNAKSEERSWFWVLLVNILPWALIIGFFVYSSRKFQERMGACGMWPFSIGKSKAKLYTRFTSNVTFDDVGGLPNAKKELMEGVEFLKDPGKFRDLGGELPKGILLVGSQGVGKMLIALGHCRRVG
ncbi:MAG: ATP-dependent metallopeptidase FtsH/Yme1/Tma family protein, partial [Deltaproteobacteria bacterium]